MATTMETLTEESRYESQISVEGVITMTEFTVILKGGAVYLRHPMETTVYTPGDDPKSLPGYGPTLAQAVWNEELVTAYVAEHPVPEDEPIE